jgi:uncharacterized protein (UPF0332 family)
MGLDIDKLLKKGVIVRADISREEIIRLSASAEDLLADADQLSSTDPVKSFARAYDAVFAACRAFMLSSGYCIASEPDHRSVLQFCELTVDEVCGDILRQFQAAEIRRHHEMYDGRYSIDEAEVDSLINRARILIKRLSGK